jgi:hypothetical protein
MEALSSSEMLEQTSITQYENTTNDQNDITVIKLSMLQQCTKSCGAVKLALTVPS